MGTMRRIQQFSSKFSQKDPQRTSDIPFVEMNVNVDMFFYNENSP